MKRTWGYYKTLYPNGTDEFFEDHCLELLIKRKHLDRNKIIRVPNQKGVEIEPIYSEVDSKTISFQSKCFLSSTNYPKILRSVNNAISEYGKVLDRIYLFCPRNLTINCPNYINIVEALDAANIELVTLTGDTLMNMFIEDGFLPSKNPLFVALETAAFTVKNIKLTHYTNEKMPMLFGREYEQAQLQDFIRDDAKIRIWAVTGAAGVGKSKLIYDLCNTLDSDEEWKCYFVKCEKLPDPKNIENGWVESNLLIGIDYADQDTERVGNFLNLLIYLGGKSPNKIRILFISRAGKDTRASWFGRIDDSFSGGLEQLVHNTDFLTLKGINIENALKIKKRYFEALNMNTDRVTDSEFKNYIRKHLIDSDGKIEPLYVLIALELLYTKKNNGKHELGREGILQDSFKTMCKHWSKALAGEPNSDKLVVDLMMLVTYATIVGQWSIYDEIPDFLNDYRERIVRRISESYIDKSGEWFTIIAGQSIYRNDTYQLPSITPDLIGEYYVLSKIRLNREKWVEIIVDKIEESNFFVKRVVEDFGENGPLFSLVIYILKKLLVHCDADSDCYSKYLIPIFEDIPDNTWFCDYESIFVNYLETLAKKSVVWAELLAKKVYRKNIYFSSKRFETLGKLSDLYIRWEDSEILRDLYMVYLTMGCCESDNAEMAEPYWAELNRNIINCKSLDSMGGKIIAEDSVLLLAHFIEYHAREKELVMMQFLKRLIIINNIETKTAVITSFKKVIVQQAKNHDFIGLRHSLAFVKRMWKMVKSEIGICYDSFLIWWDLVISIAHSIRNIFSSVAPDKSLVSRIVEKKSRFVGAKYVKFFLSLARMKKYSHEFELVSARLDEAIDRIVKCKAMAECLDEPLWLELINFKI